MSGRQENQIARQTALAVQPGYSDNSSRHLLVGWELTKLVVRTSQGIASHRWANEASRGKNTNREHTRGWKMSASLPDISEQQAATQVLLQAYCNSRHTIHATLQIVTLRTGFGSVNVSSPAFNQLKPPV